MEYAIEIYDLSKEIDGQTILSNVTMKIKKGEIYGLLGANGAGKTTMMKIILRLLKPTYGSIKILGRLASDADNAHFSKIGSIIEYPVFYQNLTARENLELHCDYMGARYKENIDKYLQIMGISDAANKKVKSFSLGMKQRLAIARALLTNPEILILDEPINGLDPKGITDIRELLIEINKKHGTTILITSHIIAEMERIAHTVGIIEKGVMLAELSMKEIRAKKIDLETYYLTLIKGAYV